MKKNYRDKFKNNHINFLARMKTTRITDILSFCNVSDLNSRGFKRLLYYLFIFIIVTSQAIILSKKHLILLAIENSNYKMK